MPSTPIAGSVATAYATCNPENPLREGRSHPYYYDLSPVRGDIPAMQQIRDAILLSGPTAAGESFGATTLLTGHRGNGKSTELFALKKDLEQEGYFVTYIEGETAFNLTDIGWPDILLEIAQQVFEQGSAAADRGELRCRPSRGLLDNLYQWLNQTSLTTIHRQEAGAQAEGHAGVQAVSPWWSLRATFQSLWKAGSSRTREIRRELEPTASQLLTDLNRFLQHYEQELAACGRAGLVVIVDGLEKMLRRTDVPGTNSHEDLFVHHADHLKAPACHVVYTMPISLLYDQNMGDRYGQEPVLLPMVKVRTRERLPYAAGITGLREMLQRRVQLDQVFEQSAAEEFIAASGGHVRDLLRLIRTGVLVARQRKSERITARVAELAITHFANTTYAKLAQESLRELVALHQSQRLLKAHGHLALHLMVLEYWNQRPWNDLHPCVLLLPEVQEALNPPEPRPIGFSDSPR